MRLENLSSASEATPGTPGVFRFSAGVNMCTGDPPPSSVTVDFTLSGAATPGTDYDGDLTSGQVVIPIDPQTGVGEQDVEFNAKDDQEVEPDEDVTATINPSSSYDIWGATATGYVQDDDVNINVESKIIMLTATRQVAIQATDFYGNGRSVDLTVSNYDGGIIDPKELQVTTDWAGNAALDVEGLAEGDSNLVLAAPNGNQGQANQQVRPAQVVVVDNPPIYVGQMKELTVKLIDPGTQQQTTDPFVVGEPADP
jgi:hypothetical protein